MRGLSDTFLTCLKTGFLSCITDDVKRDQDLNLEIRELLHQCLLQGELFTEVG